MEGLIFGILRQLVLPCFIVTLHFLIRQKGVNGFNAAVSVVCCGL